MTFRVAVGFLPTSLMVLVACKNCRALRLIFPHLDEHFLAFFFCLILFLFPCLGVEETMLIVKEVLSKNIPEM